MVGGLPHSALPCRKTSPGTKTGFKTASSEKHRRLLCVPVPGDQRGMTLAESTNGTSAVLCCLSA